MGNFDDWYGEPERGPEIDGLFHDAIKACEGEGSEVLMAVFAELCMRRAWNAACVECLQLDTQQAMGATRQVH